MRAISSTHSMRLLAGFVLIFLASPFTLWMAEGQDFAATFESAAQVESSSTQDGFVAVYGEPTWKTPLLCPQSEENCLFVQTTVSHWELGDQIVCGELSNENIIEQVEDRCDGGYCEKCYRVENNQWIQDSQETKVAEFSIGNYSIALNEGGNYLDKQFLVDENETLKTEYSFMPAADQVLVSGEALNGQIASAGEKGIFVVSNKNHEGTLADLEMQDKSIRWGLRIFSAILMVLGWILMVSQFAAPIAGLLNIVPFLGGLASTGVKGVTYFVAAIVGFLVWLLLFLAVIILHSIWLLILVLVATLGFLWYYKNKAPKKVEKKV